MGAQRLPFRSPHLNVWPQIDRGIDNEHKGHGIEMLITTFSTSLIFVALNACNYFTARIPRCFDRSELLQFLMRNGADPTEAIVHV